MTKASLCITTLIALLIGVTDASAQSDSSTVILWVNDSISWEFPTTVTNFDGSKYYSSQSDVMRIERDSVLHTRLWGDTVPQIAMAMTSPAEAEHTQCALWFNLHPIDSTATIQFLFSEMLNVGDVNVDGRISFDSVPYTTPTQGYIEIPKAAYKCVKNWSGEIGADRMGDESGNGSGSDTSFDSLAFTLVAPGVLDVRLAFVPSTSFSIESNGRLLNASFPISSSNRIFEIVDLLGKTVEASLVLPNIGSLQIPTASLPPGCYFARLGDAVAKFIVPPR